MIYIEAPEPPGGLADLPKVFLAGGITNCPNWQQEVVQQLGKLDLLPEFVVFNPRRENFPIHDPSAAQAQIEWEFQQLERCNIFSMWFANADSDQPICMYEFGRHLARFEQGLLYGFVLGVEPGYRREQDVHIQSRLVFRRIAAAGHRNNRIWRADSVTAHVNGIAQAVSSWYNK